MSIHKFKRKPNYRMVCVHVQYGKVSQLEHVFIIESKVRFIIIPDMLNNAPMFKRLEARIKAQAASRGSSAAPGRGK